MGHVASPRTPLSVTILSVGEVVLSPTPMLSFFVLCSLACTHVLLITPVSVLVTGPLELTEEEGDFPMILGTLLLLLTLSCTHYYGNQSAAHMCV